MANCNQFEPLRALDDNVLAEIIREAEARLQSQVAIATAADQRALTIAGFQITSATASLGGGIALALAHPPDLWLALVAFAFALSMACCAHEAVQTAKPQDFHVPGNSPSGWLPDNWLGQIEDGRDIKQARIEQAACLDEAIAENTTSMKTAGARVRKSLKWSIRIITVAALVLVITFVARDFTIEEPNSRMVEIAH